MKVKADRKVGTQLKNFFSEKAKEVFEESEYYQSCSDEQLKKAVITILGVEEKKFFSLMGGRTRIPCLVCEVRTPVGMPDGTTEAETYRFTVRLEK